MQSGIFTAMVGECIDGLEPDERACISAGVLAKVVRICAEWAEDNLGEYRPVQTLPKPPDMQIVKAKLLFPGDFVWRPDFTFDVISSAHVNIATDAVQVVFVGGREETIGFEAVRRIATDRAKADDWNLNRVLFTDETLDLLVAAYGTFAE